jgi:hypothetical protein
MMKKILGIILIVLFAFTVTTIAYAAEERKASPAPTVPAAAPAEKTKIKQITGEVKAVDTRAMTITVMKKMKDQVKEITAVVNDKTKITMGKDKKTIADLKVEDKVTLKYTESAGKNMAKSIAIKPAASAEKK